MGEVYCDKRRPEAKTHQKNNTSRSPQEKNKQKIQNQIGNTLTSKSGQEAPSLARQSASELALQSIWEKETCRLLVRSEISPTTPATFLKDFSRQTFSTLTRECFFKSYIYHWGIIIFVTWTIAIILICSVQTILNKLFMRLF